MIVIVYSICARLRCSARRVGGRRRNADSRDMSKYMHRGSVGGRGGVGWVGGGVLRVNECMRTREVIHTGCEEVDVSGQCGVPFERGFES